MRETLSGVSLFFCVKPVGREISQAGTVNRKSGGKTPAGKRQAAAGSRKARGRVLAEVSPQEVQEDGEQRVSQPIPVEEFRGLAKQVLCGSFLTIMRTMAEQSEKGSLPHTKYLFQIGGVKEEIERGDGGKDEPSLADLLLAEARRHRTETPGQSGAAISGEDAVGAENERGGECGANEG